MFLPADFRELHPALAWPDTAQSGLRWIAREARERGLSLLLDVVLDRVAAGSAIAAGSPQLFPVPDIAILDPRRGHGGSEAARSRFDREETVCRWMERLIEWTDLGVAGFRLMRLGQVPVEVLSRLTSAIRERAPATLLLGWTPGLTREELAGLEGAGLEYASPRYRGGISARNGCGGRWRPCGA